jgi:glycosyltransferase 2 family protein
VNPRLKAIIQTAAIFGITVLLIWFSLRSLEVPASKAGTENKFSYLLTTWQAADKTWLLIMALLAMASHVVRAERWRMLIHPSGRQPKLAHSFLSLMVGYLVNLVIPRGGEISRCYNLYKLDNTPVEVSFGTVVVERIVDVLCLVTLVGLAFAVESQKLFDFVEGLPLGAGQSKLKLLAYILLFFVLLVVVFFIVYKKSRRVNTVVTKVWKGFKEGILSIFTLKSKGLFIFYSFLIWALYFFTTYAVIMAFPETRVLGFSAVLSLFAIGAIAMAAPLPGGTGSYHVLVPQGLVFLYGIGRSDAVAFTFIFHGWQTAIMIAGGAISLLVTTVMVRKK